MGPTRITSTTPVVGCVLSNQEMFPSSIHSSQHHRYWAESQNKNPAALNMTLYAIIVGTILTKILNQHMFLDPMAVPVHGQLRDARMHGKRAREWIKRRVSHVDD